MVEINNLSGVKVDKVFLKKITKKVFRRINNLSIAFVKPAEIKKLNKKYRKKNQPTDILSFEDINEIVICPQVVKESAKKFKSTFKKELARVLIHGILHIVGYDHEKKNKETKKMREKEEFYLKQLFTNR